MQWYLLTKDKEIWRFVTKFGEVFSQINKFEPQSFLFEIAILSTVNKNPFLTLRG